MTESNKTLSVSRAAALCGVGRTTVGYWIRSKKLHAHRIGRNYAITVDDLLFFLKNSGQQIPPELIEKSKKLIFKSFQNCWQYWQGSDHGQKCYHCIVFKNQLEACFTAKNSELSGCLKCEVCRYYQETFISRIQFVHQIEVPAAVFKDLYLWGGNSFFAQLCEYEAKDLIGLGIETIVHPNSLATVISAARKSALGDPAVPKSCRIYIKNSDIGQQQIYVSMYPLREPAGAFLVLGEAKN